MKPLLKVQEEIPAVREALDAAVSFACLAQNCFDRIEDDIKGNSECLFLKRQILGLLKDVRSQAYFAFYTLSKVSELSEDEYNQGTE